MSQINNTQLDPAKRIPTWLARLCRWLLKLGGWEVIGQPPQAQKFIMIAAPHTSYWDLFIMLAVAWSLHVRLSWLSADKFFWGPHGWLFKKWGGIPVNRNSRNNIVQQVINAINAHDYIAIAISPEGTTKKLDHWRTGFYWMAEGANIPILFSFLDYANKRTGVRDELFWPTGDIEADLEEIRSFYGPIKGKYPHKYSDIRWRSTNKNKS